MLRRSATFGRHAGGFSLIELIVVIVVTGILAGIMAVFLNKPLTGYFDASRRSELSGIADLALSRMGRDINRALPNTVRVTAAGTASFLEFIPTLAAGRYAEAATETCFATGCTQITTLSSPIAASGQYVGKSLVIFNYYNNAGGNCAADTLPSVYCGQNAATIASSTLAGNLAIFGFASTRFYPSGGSPERRYQIADAPVSYACDPAAGALTRYTGYTLAATQRTSFSGVTGSLLATRVTACGFVYQSGPSQRLGIAALRLTLARDGESITLYREAHVDNVP